MALQDGPPRLSDHTSLDFGIWGYALLKILCLGFDSLKIMYIFSYGAVRFWDPI